MDGPSANLSVSDFATVRVCGGAPRAAAAAAQFHEPAIKLGVGETEREGEAEKVGTSFKTSASSDGGSGTGIVMEREVIYFER